MAATLFAACLSRLGLSQAAAASLLKVGKVTRIKDMAAGRSRVPAGFWAELRDYEAAIVNRSEAMREVLEEASERAGGPPAAVDAVADDPLSLMGLADFFLTNDIAPGEIMVGVVRE